MIDFEMPLAGENFKNAGCGPWPWPTITSHWSMPDIKKVIFNNPATIVLWKDGSKTVVRCQEGDKYSKDTGLAMCIAKKALGNKGNFNEAFKKWIDGYGDRE